MRIVWTVPEVPSFNTMFMLEAMTFKIAIEGEKSIVPYDLVVEVWTNVYHKDNPEGVWHSIPLAQISCRSHDNLGKPGDLDLVTATFANAVMLTSYGNFEFTFRVARKLKRHGDPEPEAEGSTGTSTASVRLLLYDWIWAGDFENDGAVTVQPPSDDNWTKGPQYDHILDTVHLGNFMAASIADKLEFDAVLNVADNLDLITSNFSQPIDYKKIPMRDGAMNCIPPEQIEEAVEWLRERSSTRSKILVNCRAGIGRAGSVVVSYVFAQNLNMSYDQAYNFVFARRFVYPHRGLRETLYRLYPRN